jgi:hypothetical protein
MSRSLEVFRVRLVRISEESRRDKNLQGIVIQAPMRLEPQEMQLRLG